MSLRALRRRPVVAAVALILPFLIPAAVQQAAAENVAPEPVAALPNPSFEELDGDRPAQWILDETRAQTLAVVDTARTGERAVEITNPSGQAIALRSTPVTTRPGATVTGSVWYRSVSGTAAWFYLEFWNAAGTRITERHVMPAPAADWTQTTVSATAPNGTVAATVLLYGSSTTTGVSLADDAALDTGYAPPDPDIGTQVQLFHDLDRVASMDQVGRVVHEAETTEQPLITPTEPWESDNVYVYGTAIVDDGVHKLWYHAYNREIGDYFTLYATSPDGRTWTKPSLGLVEYDGSTDNNIVGTMHSPTVIKDAADPDPDRRYKMLAFEYGPDRGYTVYFSPDGLRWTPCDCNPVDDGADVANMFHDPNTGLYTVTWKQPHTDGRRAVFLSTSSDFETWTEPELIFEADERDQQQAVGNGLENAQVYGMPVVPYEGRYVGFPWMYSYAGAGEAGTAGDGPIDVQLAFSDDLRAWQRDDRRPVIPRGVPGSWDYGMVFTSSGLIESGDELLLYYGAWNGWHGTTDRQAAVGLARWRRDGFASLVNGGDRPGTVTTTPFVVTGDELRLNAALDKRGSLRVEVLDENGVPIPGFGADQARPIIGDRVDHLARWRVGVWPDLEGRTVSLRFHLDGGDLYSYRQQDAG
ncbi:hypothetical protein [Jiangella sp. DSM 45060]|uniref:hypothetical protein n=1 Tax=Jiangella sp. DSM 45060 TaxID=1798224 RepID=UPI0008795F4E|nr:hypothetical protein [Jiangella sp. DSM 45060]SDT72648.1 Predicted glycosyl hydrolase, GH43/DUF377 family [Jiangella sp. DSM 45060]